MTHYHSRGVQQLTETNSLAQRQRRVLSRHCAIPDAPQQHHLCPARRRSRTTPRRVVELNIAGGRFHGATLRAATKAALIAAFDRIVEAHKAHQPPYWRDPKAAP